MRLTKKLTIIMVGFFCVFGITAQSIDTEAILRNLDQLNSFPETDFSAEYTIVTQKPGDERSIFRMQNFRRDHESKLTMVILEPGSRRGEGYLQIGDTAWSYDPESREFAIFALQENFQDSSARTSDFAELTISANYEVSSAETGRLGAHDVYILDLQATNDRVTFPRIKLWLRQDNNLILREENYSLSDRLMRTVLIPGYASVQGRFVANKILIQDNLNEGERSEITVRNISFAAIPDHVFTRSYLERIGR